MTTAEDAGNLVGPVMRAGEIADAVLEAIQEESEGREVITEAHASYVRIKVADECFVRFETVGDVLGRTVTRRHRGEHAELRRVHPHRAGRHPVRRALVTRSGSLHPCVPPPTRHGRACPGHPRVFVQPWMPGTSPGMTMCKKTAVGGIAHEPD